MSRVILPVPPHLAWVGRLIIPEEVLKGMVSDRIDCEPWFMKNTDLYPAMALDCDPAGRHADPDIRLATLGIRSEWVRPGVEDVVAAGCSYVEVVAAGPTRADAGKAVTLLAWEAVTARSPEEQ